MPLIKTEISCSISEEMKKEIALASSKICSTVMGKPECYVMSIVKDGLIATMAGNSTPCAFIEVKGIGGFSPAVNKKLSAELCSMLKNKLNIHPEAVYINFTDIAASNWGWNGGTF